MNKVMRQSLASIRQKHSFVPSIRDKSEKECQEGGAHDWQLFRKTIRIDGTYLKIKACIKCKKKVTLDLLS